MKCPVCVDVSLSISSRDGVEIDFCPQCRGVWLDRGELDKILDRVATTMAPVAPVPPPTPTPSYDRGRDPRYDDRGRDPRYEDRDRAPRDDDRDRYDDRRYDKRKRRKRSMLDDLFDIID